MYHKVSLTFSKSLSISLKVHPVTKEPFVLFRKSVLLSIMFDMFGRSLTFVTFNVTLFEKVIFSLSLARNIAYLIPLKLGDGVKLTIPVFEFIVMLIFSTGSFTPNVKVSPLASEKFPLMLKHVEVSSGQVRLGRLEFKVGGRLLAVRRL